MTIYLKMVDIHTKLNASKTSLTSALLAFLLLFSTQTFAVDEAAVKEGRALFKSNCASCHNPLQNGTGPALKGVTARWEAAGDYQGKTGKEWLHSWIKNWNVAVDAKYPYAVEMGNWSPASMNLFNSLKDEEIDKILLYVDNSDLGVAPATATTAAPVVVEAKDESNTFLYLFAALLLVLAVILVTVTSKLDKAVAASKGEVIESTPFWKTRKFKVFALLLALVFVGFYLADGAIKLGRQQGYQPAQPIRYSHELHAGTHKIDCQYCHTSAAKGKTAGIPSLNTCMNCHKNVQKGPGYGTEEIAKIYDAVGWDVATQKYVRPAKPVQWVRIHNLPDHVYFNHAQHVVAGKVDCQTCHGPIQEKKEVSRPCPCSG